MPRAVQEQGEEDGHRDEEDELLGDAERVADYPPAEEGDLVARDADARLARDAPRPR